MSSLKPCPFCGNPSVIKGNELIGHGEYEAMVKCTNCSAQISDYYGKPEEKWNRRYDAVAREGCELFLRKALRLIKGLVACQDEYTARQEKQSEITMDIYLMPEEREFIREVENFFNAGSCSGQVIRGAETCGNAGSNPADLAPLPQPGNFSPYPGWKFIFDRQGACHHVPDKALLDEMCKIYYKLPTQEDVDAFNKSGGIIG